MRSVEEIEAEQLAAEAAKAIRELLDNGMEGTAAVTGLLALERILEVLVEGVK